MAKKFRKIMSVVLALSMCMSLMTVNVFATEGAEGPTDGNPAPSNPVSTTTTTTTDESGSGTASDPKITTETTTTTTTNSDTGEKTVSNETTKTTESKDAEANKETVTTEKDWDSTTTTPVTPTPDADDDKDPTVETTVNGENSTTVTTTQPNTTDSVTKTETTDGVSKRTETTEKDGLNRTTHIEGQESGKETTTETQVTKESSSETKVTTKKEPGETTTEASKLDETYNEKDKGTSSADIEIEFGTDFGSATVNLKPGDKDKSADIFFTNVSDLIGNAIPEEKITVENGVETIITHNKDEDGKLIGYTTTVKTPVDAIVPDAPEGATDLEDGDGYSYKNTDGADVTVKYTKNADGKITGYTTTTVKPVDAPAPTELNVGKTSSTVSSIDLPEKPAEVTDTTDKDGNTVKVTTTEIIGKEGTEFAGKVIGYKTTTETIDEDGNVINSDSNSIYGKVTTVTVETTPDMEQSSVTSSANQVTTTTVSNITATGVDVTNQTVTVSNGKLTASMSSVTAGQGHGDGTVTSIQPNVDGPADRRLDKNRDLFGRPDQEDKMYDTSLEKELPYQWLGDYGLESAFRVSPSGNTGGYQAHQFIVTGPDGSEFYTYCADFETNVQNGADYKMENVDDATYYQNLKNGDISYADHIREIAKTGYWGVTGDETVAGSLAAFKKSLEGKLTPEEIDDITEGIALAATQAAIWRYGNSGTTKLNDTDIVGNYAIDNSLDTQSLSNAGKSQNLLNKVYQELITRHSEATTANALLNANSILGSSITVKEKTNRFSSEGNAVYNTTVSFTMAVLPSSTNGDLVVKIAYGDEILTKRLTGNDETTKFGMLTSKNGTYSIDIPLAEGEEVTVSLEGTQQLDNGVYLYTAWNPNAGEDGAFAYNYAQTFVGLGTQTRDVNLSFNLEFNVDDPTAVMETTGKTYTTQSADKQVGTRTDTTTVTKVESDIQTTTTVVDQTEREWLDTWEQDFHYSSNHSGDDDADADDDSDADADDDSDIEIPDEDVPLGPTPDDPDIEIPEEDVPLADLPDEEVPLAELPDEEVPLADVPKTGDNTNALYALVLLSGGALACLTFVDKRRKEEA